MDTQQRHQANRAAWNEAARHYEQEIEQDITFLRAGGKNLMEPELGFLADLSLWCKRAIHLQCAGGRDTLSLWNQGWPTQYIPEPDMPAKEKQAPKHERQWTLGQIMNALVKAGLRLERFEEHPQQYWNQFPNLPQEVIDRLPHTFSLMMKRD